MEEIAIAARGLTKVFPGNVVAVAGLDMAVPKGEVYGLIGRNGAGKTTALRLLLGLLLPSRGSSEILGRDFLSASQQHRMRAAYVSQEQQLHAWMTLAELCFYVSHFYDTWDQAYAEKLGGSSVLSRTGKSGSCPEENGGKPPSCSRFPPGRRCSLWTSPLPASILLPGVS